MKSGARYPWAFSTPKRQITLAEPSRLTRTVGGYFDDTNYKLRGKERARFKKMLEDLLSAVPDTLTVDDVAELTGYHRRTILRYVQRKYIYAVNIMGKYYISKHSIINYLATDKAFKNTQKSEWHEDVILKFQTTKSLFN